MSKQPYYWKLIKSYLNNDLTSYQEIKLKEWLDQDPSHRHILSELEATWQQRSPDDQQAFLNLQHRISKSTFKEVFPWRGIAASVLLAIGLVWIIILSQQPTQSFVEHVTGPRERTTITLSDGSKVALNVNSKLKYPDEFMGSQRQLELTGEAYFEVARDEDRPFVIKSSQSETRVLGTSFNIRSYPGVEDVITVTSGKVNVSNRVNESVILTKGMQVISSRDGLLVSNEVPTSNFIAWVERKLHFNRIPISEAFEQIENTYQIDIQLTNDEFASSCLVRGFYDGESLENVLTGLKLLVDFDYRYSEEKDTLIITINGCN